MAAPGNGARVESVDRALRLLIMLIDKHSITVSDAASQLGVAPSTAHRLLATLAQREFARQDPATRAYVPGHRLLQARVLSPDDAATDVAAVARPELERLSSMLGETVHLTLLRRDAVLFMDSVESRRHVRVTSRTGAIMPAHCTAAGKVLLARCSPDRLREFLPDDRLESMTGSSITTFRELERELREVAQAGYATNFEESEPGLAAVAVALPDDVPGPMSISISAPTSRLPRERVPAIVAAARETTASIGARWSNRRPR